MQYIYGLLNSTLNLLFLSAVMVCDKCQKKLGKVITPDPWKSGARNTNESGGRKIGENKALTASRARFNPYTSKFENCKICRQKVHQAGSNYCQVLSSFRFIAVVSSQYACKERESSFHSLSTKLILN